MENLKEKKRQNYEKRCKILTAAGDKSGNKWINNESKLIKLPERKQIIILRSTCGYKNSNVNNLKPSQKTKIEMQILAEVYVHCI